MRTPTAIARDIVDACETSTTLPELAARLAELEVESLALPENERARVREGVQKYRDRIARR
jgi:hypothetical protein